VTVRFTGSPGKTGGPLPTRAKAENPPAATATTFVAAAGALPGVTANVPSLLTARTAQVPLPLKGQATSTTLVKSVVGVDILPQTRRVPSGRKAALPNHPVAMAATLVTLAGTGVAL
jgi:hypothetical protein